MRTFDNDETGYLRWLDANARGFVINAIKRPGTMAKPYMLHRACCPDISTLYGDYTTNSTAKICSVSRQELMDWGTRHSDNFKICQHCKP